MNLRCPYISVGTAFARPENCLLSCYIDSVKAFDLKNINALALQFRDTLLIASSYKQPYSSPVLPAELRTPARMQALAPFLEALPNLTPLLLKPQENNPS